MEEKDKKSEYKKTKSDFNDFLKERENDFVKGEIWLLVIKTFLVIIPILIGIFLDDIIDFFKD